MHYRIVDHYSMPKCKPQPFPATKEDLKLMREENEAALSNLVNLTANGKIQWTCTNYMPINTMPADKRDNLYLWQSFDVETTYNGHVFKLELIENIKLPSGRGDMQVEYKPDWDSVQGGGTSLSVKHENYEIQHLSYISKHYRDDSITRLHDLIIPSVVGSEAVGSGFAMKYIKKKLYSQNLLNHKLFRLSQCLRLEKRALDFHMCVLDIDHRERLYQEYGIE